MGALGTVRIPAVANEALLAGVKTRTLEDDEGVDAARLLQSAAWGKDITARIFCEHEGKLIVNIYEPGHPSSINEQLVNEGLARVSKPVEVNAICAKMVNSDNLSALITELRVA